MASCYIDADMLIHRAGYASSYISFVHTPSGTTRNIGEAKRHIKEKFGLRKQPSTTELLNKYDYHYEGTSINVAALRKCVTSMVNKIYKLPVDDFIYFETGPNNFRYELDSFEPYKGNREPHFLNLDFIKKEIEDEFSIRFNHIDGLEADDAIACRALCNDYIVSGDKDFLQLPNIHLVSLGIKAGATTITRTDTKSARAAFCSQMLTGDVADNIPGLPGIGTVKAKHITKSWESLDSKTVYFMLAAQYQSHLLYMNLDKKEPYSTKEVAEFSQAYFHNNGNLLWLKRHPEETFGEEAFIQAYT